MPQPESWTTIRSSLPQPVDTHVDPAPRSSEATDRRGGRRSSQPRRHRAGRRRRLVVAGPAARRPRPPPSWRHRRSPGRREARTRAAPPVHCSPTARGRSARLGVFLGPPLIVVCPSARHVNGLPRVATTPVRGRHRDRDTRRSSDQAALAWIRGARMGGAGSRAACKRAFFGPRGLHRGLHPVARTAPFFRPTRRRTW